MKKIIYAVLLSIATLMWMPAFANQSLDDGGYTKSVDTSLSSINHNIAIAGAEQERMCGSCHTVNKKSKTFERTSAKPNVFSQKTKVSLVLKRIYSSAH